MKLADSSEQGWRVVQEYEANPLVDNSDDEKQISHAYYHAERKIKLERRVRQRCFAPYQTQSDQTTNRTTNMGSNGADVERWVIGNLSAEW